MANFEIIWNARISGVTPGTAVGLFLVYNGANYIPATTANLALFTEVRGCIYAIPSSTTAIIQQVGDVDASITGCTNAAFGYAVLNPAGYAVWAAIAAPGDTVVGTFEGTMLRLSLSGAGSSGATSANGVQVISPLDFGATGVGNADADTQGFDNAVQAIRDAGYYLQTGYELYITPLPLGRHYRLNRPIVMNSDGSGSFSGVRISGGTDTPNGAYGGALIRWYMPNVAFSNATVTVSALDDSTGAGPTHRNTVAVTLGGAAVVAAIAAGLALGDRLWCSASSHADFVGPHTIRAISATTITVGGWDNAASYPGSMTGLYMRRRDFMFESNGRENLFTNITVEVYEPTAYLDSVISTSKSPNAGADADTAIGVDNIHATAPTGELGNIVEVGTEFLPLAGSSDLITDPNTGLSVVISPNNCDVYRLSGNFLGAGASGFVIYSTNTTQQSRAHIVHNNASINGDAGSNGVIGVGVWGAAGSRQGSISISGYELTGNAHAGPMIRTGIINAPNLYVYPNMENGGQLLSMNLYAGQSIQGMTFLSGYFNLAGDTGATGYVRDPFIDVSNCTMQFFGSNFTLTSNSNVGGGVSWFRFWAQTPSLTLIGCTIPHQNMLNGGFQFKYGTVSGGYAKLTMIGCRAYDTNTSTTYEIKNVFNKTITADYNAEYSGGNELTQVSGLSATAVPVDNLAGEATVSTGSTTAVWTRTETSATKLIAIPVPKTVSGGASAGSTRVRSCVATTTEVTITVEADPGGVTESVVFGIMQVRAP